MEDTLPAAPEGPSLAPGQEVGAYRIVRLVGRGGMGEVYEAHDPRLERSVAIKILLRGAATGSHDDGRQRLTREALALAKLSHPNIVAVHEIGSLGDKEHEEVFVVMELVAGGTLRDWLVHHRDTREILDLFIGAGRGLAAAHGARLVHRDFKPDNILVDAGGRARVSDFGLVTHARSSGGDHGPPDLTRSAGTPTYMAPEQYQAGTVDARTDQYAFCLVLFEALFGRVPFPGQTYDEVRAAKARGLGEVPRRPRRVSPEVEAALRRGLDPDPARRFPSMEPILDVLARDPRAARRRALITAAIAAVAAAAVYIPARLAGRDDGDVCGGATQRLAGVWDEAAKRRLATSFTATGRPYAREAAAAAGAALDGWFAAWAAAFRDACEATARRREQSAAALDLRMVCLDRRLAEARALVDLYTGRPEATVVDRAVDGVAGLTSVAHCGDVEALAAAPPLPADAATRARVVELRQVLARQKALALAGKARDARVLAESLAHDARSAGYPPLLAEALVALGLEEWNAGDVAPAEEHLREALVLATRARDDELVSDAWACLQGTVRRAGRFADAALLDLPYDLAVERAGGDRARRATMLLEKARTQGELGRFTEARALAEEALAMRVEIFGARRPEVARTLSIVAGLLYQQGQLLAALARRRLALSIEEEAYGRTHARVASQLDGIGLVLTQLGRPVEAQAALDRAVTIFQLVDSENANLAEALVDLGALEVERGRALEARVHLESARAILERGGMAGGPRIAKVLIHLGRLEGLAGHLEVARQRLAEALALVEGAYPPSHPMVTDALLARAQVEVAAGHPDLAEPFARRAAAPGARARGRALSLLARILCATGRAVEGLSLAEQALALRATLAPGGLEVTDARQTVADCATAAPR